MEFRGTNAASLGQVKASDATLPLTIKDFDGDIERLSKLLQTLFGHAERLAGSRPSPVEGDKIEPPANSLISDLQRQHRCIARLLADCESQAQRIADAIY